MVDRKNVSAKNVLISVFVSDIATVFGFIGSTVNPITGYMVLCIFAFPI